MLLFLLCIILLINCIISYNIFEKRFISPSVITNFVFLFSSVFLLFYSKPLDFELDIRTFLLIIFSNFAVFIGEYISFRLKQKDYIKWRNLSDFKIGNAMYFIGFVIVLGSFGIYLNDVIQLSISKFGSAIGFIVNAKILKVTGDFKVSFLAGQGYLASEIIVDLFIFSLLKSIVFEKKVIKNPFLYFSVLIYILNVLITATRSRILNLFIYTFVLFFIMNYSNKKQIKKSTNGTFKMLLKSVPIFAALLILFYFAGSLTGKIDSYNNIGENLLNYCGMSIYNLNYYIRNANEAIFNSSNTFFGIHTLSGPYSFFRGFGFDIPDDIIALEYIQSNLVLGNVFTPLRRYFQDFGLLGTFIISGFIGFLYGWLINVSIRKSNSLIAILTAYFVYPIFFWSIEERFFMDVLLINRTIYILFYFILFSRLFFKKETVSNSKK